MTSNTAQSVNACVSALEAGLPRRRGPGYDPATLPAWTSFANIAGQAAGALIGLLFVAVSIRIEVIAKSAWSRNRAAQTLGLFVTVLLIAILLSVPGQSRHLIGVEFLVVAAFVGSVLEILDRRARPTPPRSRWPTSSKQ